MAKIYNIKSKIILKKIFIQLGKNKFFNIIRYNKNLQNKFNICLNNYKKEYYEIEIEINMEDNSYDKFINVDKEYIPYLHVYFDNNKEEIKRNYTNELDKFKNIKVILNQENNSLKNLFRHRTLIKKINFIKFNRKDIIDMSSLFMDCVCLKELDIHCLKTFNVVNMTHMFSDCSSLKELNITNFVTNNVIDMSYMFDGCTSLEKLIFPKFNNDNVKNMSYIFNRCYSLKELDLSNFNTNNVVNMEGMFCFCHSLKKLDLSNFNTYNVTNMTSMFYDCTSLEQILILLI